MQATADAPEIFHARARRLSRGEYVVRMARIGPPHAEIVDRLNLALVRALGDGARVRIQQPFAACDESEPEPDVAVVPARSYASGHPAEAFLIIEVAETSLDYDRKTKAPLYAASGVKKYWIVDVAAQTVEVHANAVDGRYTLVRRLGVADALEPGALEGVKLAVADLFG